MPVRSEVVNLSPAKAFKRVADYSRRIVKNLSSASSLRDLVQTIQEGIRYFATREKRKHRLTTVQHLLQGGDASA